MEKLIINDSLVAPEQWVVDDKTRYLYKGYGIYFEVNDNIVTVSAPGEKKVFTDYLDAVNMINLCLQSQIDSREIVIQYELELMNKDSYYLDSD